MQLVLRAARASLLFALPLAGLWALSLWLLMDHPRLLRLAAIGIYAAALLGAFWVGRRLGGDGSSG